MNGQKTETIINAVFSGRVIDETTKEPLVGATVQIIGTTHGVTTDEEGIFKFQTGQKFPISLAISYLGYKTTEYIANATNVIITLSEDVQRLGEVTITSRRREETAQSVPIPITVLKGSAIEDQGAFNVNRLKELVPTVQFYSSNPRNTTLNIRGLGSTFGLTNDGIDPGVGFYVDGVYYARPAATALDFIDIDQVEVLRGPQGTLFGKNTTAGAFNVSSRAASFSPDANFEL
ncbi:MAG TPA: carboxypeptidase-like regulatory domain-containing protein, partial [Saprospiraceae bacterium]|nr:carboxypeptidase-like regulatory domain-containing protein [Saprospiraceae bacterium]